MASGVVEMKVGRDKIVDVTHVDIESFETLGDEIIGAEMGLKVANQIAEMGLGILQHTGVEAAIEKQLTFMR